MTDRGFSFDKAESYTLPATPGRIRNGRPPPFAFGFTDRPGRKPLPLDSMLRAVRGWPFSLRACLQLFRLRKIVGLNRPYSAQAGEQDCRC